MPPRKAAASKKKKEESSDEETTTSTIFEDSTFMIVGRLSKTQSAITELIEDNGGSVAKSAKGITHIITTQSEVDKGNAKLEDLEESIKIVSEDFIHDSISKGKKLSEDDYKLGGKSSKRKADQEEEEEEEEEEEKPKKGSRAKKPKVESKKGSKQEVEEEEEEESKKVKIIKKGRGAVDIHCPGAARFRVIDLGGVVYNAMLNQTDISFGQKGHNKFYVVQALEGDDGKGGFYCWTRWGRVGVKGQSKLEPCGSATAAIKAFEKKFYEKTKNNWSDRKNFKLVNGKYDLIDIDDGEEEADEEEINDKLVEKRAARGPVEKKGSKLHPSVQELIKLIFDMNMFEQTLVEFEIDVKKMPLGKISKNQIQKGYEVLEEIEEVLKGKKTKGDLASLCSRFYTIIPHDFGFKKPPIINDLEALQQKMDLLTVLGDMEVAAKMLESEKKKDDEEHPYDVKYKMLTNDIVPLDKKSDEYTQIETYLKNTSESYRLTLLDVYAIKRHGERDTTKKFDHIKERKLLWHGSKVAVFAAILSGGLKIMPHSGGRVGRGLYFADIVAKSASYCGLHNNTGLILLNEVFIGKQHEITKDDPSLVKAPSGTDSVIARGIKMPDPSADIHDTKLSEAGHPVAIPQGKIKNVPIGSSFAHNEYLVYDASQVSMKYLLRLKWN